MKTVKLTHVTVKGIDKRWEEIDNFPFGVKLAWEPDWRCVDCGLSDAVVTRRPTFVEDIDDRGVPLLDSDGEIMKHKGDDVYSVVCPRCITFRRDDEVVATLDRSAMTVTILDSPRRPTEDELRPCRWRQGPPPMEYTPDTPRRIKHITLEEYKAWLSMVEADAARRRDYAAKLHAWERTQRTKPVRTNVRRAKVKPEPFRGMN